MKSRKKLKNSQPDINFAKTSLLDFITYYNQNIPKSFPRASQEMLEKFRRTHAGLFDGGSDEWIIEKHRKRVMDWLSSNVETSKV